MVMPSCGTFDYVAVVPESLSEGEFECKARVRERVRWSWNKLRAARLIGPRPRLRVADAGAVPDTGTKDPAARRSRFTLIATWRYRATLSTASFHIDSEIVSRLRRGDVLHMVRTACAGLGLSVVRENELMVAIGAITAVPLGIMIHAWITSESRVLRRRDAISRRERQLAIEVGGVSALAGYGYGVREVGDYNVFVEHGYLVHIPGTDECAAIWRKGFCSTSAARASARLLGAGNALSMTSW